MVAMNKLMTALCTGPLVTLAGQILIDGNNHTSLLISGIVIITHFGLG